MMKGNHVILYIKNDVTLPHVPSTSSRSLGVKHSERRKMVLMPTDWAQVEMLGDAESIMGSTEVQPPELQRPGRSVALGIR